VPDYIPDDSPDKAPLVDTFGRIKTPEEIEAYNRAEQDRREHHYRKLLLEAETRQANAQHVQANASRSIGFLTAGLVIVSLISGCVSYLQFVAANENARAAESAAVTARQTLKEVQSSGEDTKKLAADTHDLASAAKSQAEASKVIADSEKTVAFSTQRQAAISASAAKSAETAIHLTESADIILEGIACSTTGETVLRLDTELNGVWRNAGRGGASKVKASFSVGLYGAEIAPLTEMPSESYIGAGTVLQSTKKMRIGPSIGNTDEARMANLTRINDGTLPFHAWGWVTYEDRFRGKHLLVYDATYIPRSKCEFRTVKVVGISH